MIFIADIVQIVYTVQIVDNVQIVQTVDNIQSSPPPAASVSISQAEKRLEQLSLCRPAGTSTWVDIMQICRYVDIGIQHLCWGISPELLGLMSVFHWSSGAEPRPGLSRFLGQCLGHFDHFNSDVDIYLRLQFLRSIMILHCQPCLPASSSHYYYRVCRWLEVISLYFTLIMTSSTTSRTLNFKLSILAIVIYI